MHHFDCFFSHRLLVSRSLRVCPLDYSPNGMGERLSRSLDRYAQQTIKGGLNLRFCMFLAVYLGYFDSSLFHLFAILTSVEPT